MEFALNQHATQSRLLWVRGNVTLRLQLDMSYLWDVNLEIMVLLEF